MTNKYKLSIILLSIIFSSCAKCPCIDQDLDPNFIGFEVSEVDTVIIRKYAKNNNFNNLIDTAFFDEKTSFTIQKNSDTISFPVRSGNFSINKNYDWVLFLPSINRNFKISDIISPQVSLPCPNKLQCINPIHSLSIDGTIYKPSDVTFYVKK